MLKKPFDNLPAVTELIELRKKMTVRELSNHFKCSYDLVEATLKYWGIRKNVKSEPIIPTPTVIGKYDHLIEEPTNKGHDYAELLKRHGGKVVKEWFGTIRGKRYSYHKEYREKHLERRKEIEKNYRSKPEVKAKRAVYYKEWVRKKKETPQ